MNLTRVILCVICPPLAVMDKGCGSILIVCLLTLAGGVPGIIGALIILNKDGSLNKGFENSFVASFLLTLVLAFFILVILYILFYK